MLRELGALLFERQDQHEQLRLLDPERQAVLLDDFGGLGEMLGRYRQLRRELELHDRRLAEKSFLVAANKMDLPSAEKNLEKFREELSLSPEKIFPISALRKDGLDKLKSALFEIIPDSGEIETADETD